MDKILKKVSLNYVFEMSYSIIIVIGILGNATNILVLSRKTMRKSLTFQLYLYLSIIDLAFLTQTGTELFLKYLFQIEMREISVVFCKLNTFLSYFLMQTRNVFTMSITLSYLFEISKLNPSEANKSKTDKTITTQKPSNINTDSAKFLIKIRKILLLTLSVLCLLNIHFILFLNIHLNMDDVNFTRENSKILEVIDLFSVMKHNTNIDIHVECSPYRYEFYVHFLRNIWVWIDMIIYFLIPFSVNLIAFLFIFFYINRLNKRYSNFLNIENYKSNTHIYLKRMRKNRRIVWRLFTLNAYFFFSSLPSYVSYYSLDFTRTHLFLNYLCYILFYSNNSLNFLFYSLTSEKYRNELLKIFRNKRSLSFSKKKRINKSVCANELLKIKCVELEKALVEKDEEIVELTCILEKFTKREEFHRIK
jgi:hypothetical protein